MKIRIEGKEDKCIALAYDLQEHYVVNKISAFYPNRRKNIFDNEGWIYIDIDLKTSHENIIPS